VLSADPIDNTVQPKIRIGPQLLLPSALAAVLSLQEQQQQAGFPIAYCLLGLLASASILKLELVLVPSTP